MRKNIFAMKVKRKLKGIISEMTEFLDSYVMNPGKDFVRNRKLGFEKTIELIIGMSGETLRDELLEYFTYDEGLASVSALCQQRGKLKLEAFRHIFETFTATAIKLKLYKGYRLLAVDGSSLNIYHNPDNPDSYIRHSGCSKGYSSLHLNALFDLKNKLYVDAYIQPGRKMNEYQSLCTMVDRSKIKGKVIVIGDRGYESYNAIAHVIEKGWNYLIRAKDVKSNCIARALDLPQDETFDTIVTIQLSRSKAKKIKDAYPYYKHLVSSQPFDFLKNTKDVYEMTIRVVRIKGPEGAYRLLFTNLPKDEFSYDDINELYNQRWGIETSFRELKHVVGLIYFHSKKVEFIHQEIYASLILYNFCEMITMQVVIKQKKTKYVYQVNFTAAIDICREFFNTKKNKRPPNVEALIQRFVLPVREGRKFDRSVRRGHVISFNYRLS